jgi:hypothetical protein
LDIPEAAAKLTTALAWRADIRPGALTPAAVAGEAATGKAFLHAHPDAGGRPVVVVTAARHVTGAAPLRKTVELGAHLVERAVALAGDPLAVEGGGGGDAAAPAPTTTTAPRPPPATPPPPAAAAAFSSPDGTLLAIIDLHAFGPRNADFAFMRFLVDALYSYYPRRVAAVLLVDAPPGFAAVWAVVRPWLGKYGRLARFVSAGEVCDVYFEGGAAPAGIAGRAGREVW